MDAILALEDGRIFKGQSVGADVGAEGEVVFNTSMTGYQEVLTDPSYRGQIVVMTYPHIGNTGVNGEDRESRFPKVAGFVVRELELQPSNWRSTQDLPTYLKTHGIPCIHNLDTRALTRHLRDKGAMRGIITTHIQSVDEAILKAKGVTPLKDLDLVGDVTCNKSHNWEKPRNPRWAPHLKGVESLDRPHCVAIDFGAKQNILMLLHEAGFKVTVVPASTSANEILSSNPDGVFLSNGPGDPEVVETGIATVRDLIGKVPVFGICLGHQIAALAMGGKTFKLKFGHRGANHPVKDLRSGSVAITSQNHGYAVDPDSLPDGTEVTHVNLNDGTLEGFYNQALRVKAVQYHPESSPGPHDALDWFMEFKGLVDGSSKQTQGEANS